MKGPRCWLRSSRQLLLGSRWRGACTVAAPDAIAAFAVPNPGCSSRGSRFFRVWWLGESPRQADHSAYFGSVNLGPTLSTVDNSTLLLPHREMQVTWITNAILSGAKLIISVQKRLQTVAAGFFKARSRILRGEVANLS